MKSQTEEFEQHRPLMFSIAYRMLGTVSDAEDMVQEAYLRWQKTERDAVKSSKSFLCATVTRLCIDYLRSARVRREQYVGPWLPEPLLAEQGYETANTAELAESLSVAFLMMLENLTPSERAVFLLHDIFGFDFEEVGRQIDKTAINCRQICSRARRQIKRKQARFEPNRERAEQLAAKFISACKDGNLDRLVQMMADDVTLYSDGGGKVPAARRPVRGALNVARFLIGVTKNAPPDTEAKPVVVNGRPGLAVLLNGTMARVFSLEFGDSGLQAICVVGNPDKLQHLQH